MRKFTLPPRAVLRLRTRTAAQRRAFVVTDTDAGPSLCESGLAGDVLLANLAGLSHVREAGTLSAERASIDTAPG